VVVGDDVAVLQGRLLVQPEQGEAPLEGAAELGEPGRFVVSRCAPARVGAQSRDGSSGNAKTAPTGALIVVLRESSVMIIISSKMPGDR